jgi:hypothetical protein
MWLTFSFCSYDVKRRKPPISSALGDPARVGGLLSGARRQRRHTGVGQFIGLDQTSSAHRQDDVIDPNRLCAPVCRRLIGCAVPDAG